MPDRVLVTPAAATLIRRLKHEYGPLIFHQSGGCCEGTAPMCFRQSDFRVGQRDVFLGMIEGCPFYIGPGQYEYSAYSQITVDITTGGGDSFSLEAPEGVRFATRSRLFTDAEAKALDAAGPPPTGPDAMRRKTADPKAGEQT